MNKAITMSLIAGFALTASPAIAEGDAVKGAKVFKKCMACHDTKPGKSRKQGPTLSGIIGRDVASVEGYKYSAPMAAYGEGKTWDIATLDAFLADPKGVAGRRIKMVFPGLKKESDRANVIAYIETLK